MVKLHSEGERENHRDWTVQSERQTSWHAVRLIPVSLSPCFTLYLLRPLFVVNPLSLPLFPSSHIHWTHLMILELRAIKSWTLLVQSFELGGDNEGEWAEWDMEKERERECYFALISRRDSSKEEGWREREERRRRVMKRVKFELKTPGGWLLIASLSPFLSLSNQFWFAMSWSWILCSFSLQRGN